MFLHCFFSKSIRITKIKDVLIHDESNVFTEFNPHLVRSEKKMRFSH